jgi:uncharacterized LabA/DUF88 family protein
VTTDRSRRVIMLIDYDNLQICASRDAPGTELDLHAVMELAQSYGTVVAARAYAEWNMPAERLAVYKAGIEPIFAPVLRTDSRGRIEGKSLCDTVMVAEGVDLIWTLAPEVLVLVTSDKDLIPLARFARQRGASVVVVGSDLTAVQLVEMCNVLITYRQLVSELGKSAEAVSARAGVQRQPRERVRTQSAPAPAPRRDRDREPARDRDRDREPVREREIPMAPPVPQVMDRPDRVAPALSSGLPSDDAIADEIGPDGLPMRRRRRRRGGRTRLEDGTYVSTDGETTGEISVPVDAPDLSNGITEPSYSEIVPSVETSEVGETVDAAPAEEEAAPTPRAPRRRRRPVAAVAAEGASEAPESES